MQLIDLMILARLQFALQFQNILQFHRTAINWQLTSLTEVHFIGPFTANKLWLRLRFGLNFFGIAKYYYYYFFLFFAALWLGYKWHIFTHILYIYSLYIFLYAALLSAAYQAV